jgi:brefeldin A-inhibited guanine nucleotide-exchange protein
LAFQSEEWPPKRSNESSDDGGQIDEDAIEVSTTTTDVSDVSEASVEEESSKNFSVDQHEPDDDSQTREPMHESVISVCEALMSVVTHPSRTPTVCELALDGITRLVNKGYVSGRAGSSREQASEQSLLHRILESVTKCNETTATVVQAAVLSTLRAILTSPKCGVHENALLMVLRTTFHVYLVVNDDANKEMARETLQDILRVAFTRMEEFDQKHQGWKPQQRTGPVLGDEAGDADVVTSQSKVTEPLSSHEEKEAALPDSAAFSSQYHSDCYALFRILCKMSSKELPADTADEPDRARLLFVSSQTQTDPLALNSKILALECILVALESHCGPAFCQSDRFGHLVQHYLCVSLLKNCVSHHTQIAFVSQKIFVVLVRFIFVLMCLLMVGLTLHPSALLDSQIQRPVEGRNSCISFQRLSEGTRFSKHVIQTKGCCVGITSWSLWEPVFANTNLPSLRL